MNRRSTTTSCLWAMTWPDGRATPICAVRAEVLKVTPLRACRSTASTGWGRVSRFYLFEAPIDLLSYLTLHKDGWQKHSHAAACSVSDKVLFQCLRDAPQLLQIFLCLDSDNAGQRPLGAYRKN